MPKKKLNLGITINEARRICINNNIKIYPIYHLGRWYVEVEQNGKKKRFDKVIGVGMSLTSNKPNYKGINWIEAIDKTNVFYAEQILNQKNKSDGIDKRNSN
jgi:hypothetical protein